MAWVGVVERGELGGGVEIGTEGRVERLPEVMNGVRSRISGKMMRIEFFIANWP